MLQRAFDDTAFHLSHVAGYAFLVATRYVICQVVQTFSLVLSLMLNFDRRVIDGVYLMRIFKVWDFPSICCLIFLTSVLVFCKGKVDVDGFFIFTFVCGRFGYRGFL